MSFFKRFIAVLAVMCMLLSTACFVGYAQENTEELASLLIDLGIYSSDDDMELSQNTITREEAASILSVFYGVTAAEYSVETPYGDVGENWSSGHIMTMISAGVMSAYDDGLFYPQRKVTVAETVKMLVTMTGYQPVAENRGGYPDGYMAVAAARDIVKNSVADVNAPITKGEFTQLLYNALQVDLLEQTTVGAKNEFASEKGKNLLSERLSIYKAEGTVNALAHTAIDYRTEAGTDKIRIDDVNYVCRLDAEPYLGLSVKVYYRQRGGEAIGEILSIAVQEGRSRYIDVDAEDIQAVTKTAAGVRFEYEANGRNKSVTLPNDLVVIFNGTRMTYYTANVHLFPKQGNVRLLDADNDGGYECASVNYYVNYFVESVTDEDGVIYITDQGGRTPIVIDSADSSVTCRAYQSGRMIDPTEIKANDVISVAADQMDLAKNMVLRTATYIKMHRSDVRATGVITRKDSDGIELDGYLYDVAEDFDESAYSLPLGETVTVYINYCGAVCAAESAKGTTAAYAILQAVSTRGQIDESATLKLFTTDGAFLKLACNDKLTIDGYSKKEYKNVKDCLQTTAAEFERITAMGKNSSGVWQLVTYTLAADGSVKTIDTLCDNKNPSENDLSFFGATPTGGTSIYLGNGGCFNSLYGVDDKTVFFTVGDPETEDDYGFVSLISIPNTDSTTQYFFFDADDMSIAPVAIRTGVKPSTTIATNEFTNLMVYEKLLTKTNANGIEAPFIYGRKLDTGDEVELELSNSSLLANGGDAIVPGNFIRWAASGAGVACKLEKVLDINKTGTPKSSFNNTVRFSRGTAKRLNSSYILTTFTEGTESFDEPAKLSNAKYIYIFNRRTGKLSTASLADIRPSDQYGSDADTIGLFVRSGGIKAIVIYR